MSGLAEAREWDRATLDGSVRAGLRRCRRCIQERGLRGLAGAVRRQGTRKLRDLLRLVFRPALSRPAVGPAVPLAEFAGRATTWKLENAQLFAEQQPWCRAPKALADVNPIPSMIHPDEAHLLYWLAAHRCRGVGTIVDLGPLAGGSTHALAAGLADNERALPPCQQIDSYDLWTYEEPFQQYFPGETLRPGDDLQPRFEANLGRLRPYVAAHKGDLCSYSGNGGPIEILFIDAAKSPALMLTIARHFFPRLIPGHSIVVHQDYISSTCPWIHLAMEQLRDYWELVDSPEGGSVCFVTVRPLPADALSNSFFATLSVREARQLLKRAQANLRGWYKLCLCLAEAFYLTQVQEYAAAEGLVRQVVAHPDFCASLRYDVDYVLEHLPCSHF